MVYAAGFGIEKRTKPYIIEFNVHPSKIPFSPKQAARKVALRYLTGTNKVGILHQALLSKPRI